MKILWDANLSEDQEFFAAVVKEEFGDMGCITRVEQVYNKAFLTQYAKPMNDFTIYTTAMPNVEGIRMISCMR